MKASTEQITKVIEDYNSIASDKLSYEDGKGIYLESNPSVTVSEDVVSAVVRHNIDGYTEIISEYCTAVETDKYPHGDLYDKASTVYDNVIGGNVQISELTEIAAECKAMLTQTTELPMDGGELEQLLDEGKSSEFDILKEKLDKNDYKVIIEDGGEKIYYNDIAAIKYDTQDRPTAVFDIENNVRYEISAQHDKIEVADRKGDLLEQVSKQDVVFSEWKIDNNGNAVDSNDTIVISNENVTPAIELSENLETTPTAKDTVSTQEEKSEKKNIDNDNYLKDRISWNDDKVQGQYDTSDVRGFLKEAMNECGVLVIAEKSYDSKSELCRGDQYREVAKEQLDKIKSAQSFDAVKEVDYYNSQLPEGFEEKLSLHVDNGVIYDVDGEKVKPSYVIFCTGGVDTIEGTSADRIADVETTAPMQVFVKGNADGEVVFINSEGVELDKKEVLESKLMDYIDTGDTNKNEAIAKTIYDNLDIDNIVSTTDTDKYKSIPVDAVTKLEYAINLYDTYKADTIEEIDKYNKLVDDISAKEKKHSFGDIGVECKRLEIMLKCQDLGIEYKDKPVTTTQILRQSLMVAACFINPFNTAINAVLNAIEAKVYDKVENYKERIEAESKPSATLQIGENGLEPIEKPQDDIETTNGELEVREDISDIELPSAEIDSNQVESQDTESSAEDKTDDVQSKDGASVEAANDIEGTEHNEGEIEEASDEAEETISQTEESTQDTETPIFSSQGLTEEEIIAMYADVPVEAQEYIEEDGTVMDESSYDYVLEETAESTESVETDSEATEQTLIENEPMMIEEPQSDAEENLQEANETLVDESEDIDSANIENTESDIYEEESDGDEVLASEERPLEETLTEDKVHSMIAEYENSIESCKEMILDLYNGSELDSFLVPEEIADKINQNPDVMDSAVSRAIEELGGANLSEDEKSRIADVIEQIACDDIVEWVPDEDALSEAGITFDYEAEAQAEHIAEFFEDYADMCGDLGDKTASILEDRLDIEVNNAEIVYGDIDAYEEENPFDTLERTEPEIIDDIENVFESFEDYEDTEY